MQPRCVVSSTQMFTTCCICIFPWSERGSVMHTGSCAGSDEQAMGSFILRLWIVVGRL